MRVRAKIKRMKRCRDDDIYLRLIISGASYIVKLTGFDYDFHFMMPRHFWRRKTGGIYYFADIIPSNIFFSFHDDDFTTRMMHS